MEATWLAAIILVPLFFDIYSSRIFEPDKITLLRTLALLSLLAWIVKLVDEGGLHWGRIERKKNWFETLRNIPLALPVIALILVYIVSAIFSVTPRVSFLGSYQRLQGTYSMLSYVMIFLTMAVNLRRREQVHRLITTVILASLPISLYGILQRYSLDPIPWGGDVTARIASNMGNSIFVAAYLIMVFPLTFMRMVEAFEALLVGEGKQAPDFVRATAYVFIGALQLIGLYYSNSRGPWLGWGASLVFLGLGLSLIWRARWMTISGVVLATAAAVFLILLNIPNGPLESLRTRPEFGRLGQLLDAESRTGRVRVLIWQGASELVQPHEPLEYPDGTKDAFNFLRPLIGYGPESMYVAYNRFYPPELTLVEKRNASPDRSHNETWDSLVITGLFGLAVYLTLFGSVIYFGLKWLGLVQTSRQRYWFLGLFLGGGILSAIAFVAWRGLPYFGVSLPAGMMLGVMVYLILVSLFGHFKAPSSPQEKLRAYILLGLLAAVVAHFIEINFGIAIASTRTYFWVYAGLLLLVGYVLPKYGEYGEVQLGTSPVQSPVETEAPADEPRPDQARRSDAAQEKKAAASAAASARRKRQAGAQQPEAEQGERSWLRQAVALGLIMAIVIMTLGYLYITNASRETSLARLIVSSLTRLKPTDANSASSGVVALLLTVWVGGALLLVSERIREMMNHKDRSQEKAASENQLALWLKMSGVALGVSFLAALIYWFWHAGILFSLSSTTANSQEQLLAQVKQSESILSNFYIFIFLMLFGLAYVLAPEPSSRWVARQARSGVAGIVTAVVGLFIFLLMWSMTNLQVIQADIAFKTADLFARPESWPVAIKIYDHANDLAPNEDYYYLFLGRAYLEYAKTISKPEERDALIQQAASDLKKALEINPLNTDHTANLARMYSLWASTSTDAAVREERGRISADYFDKALSLSPNSARLWDEAALLYLNVLQQPQVGFEKLNRALEIDPYYDWTYALLGDYYARFVASAADVTEEARQEALQKTAGYYTEAINRSTPDTGALKLNYILALAGTQSELGQMDAAIATYQQALEMSPASTDSWRIQEVLARMFVQKGDLATALQYAQQALSGAPDDQKDRLQALVAELGG